MQQDILGKQNTSLIIGLCVLLTACVKLGPDFEQPNMALPEHWQNTTFKTSANSRYSHWWQSFNDKTLNTLIETAQQQNLDLQLAAARLIEARAQLGLAKGSLFPQKQQVETGFAYNKMSEHMPNMDRFVYNSYDIAFDAIWEIDIWGKFSRGIEAAQANLDANNFNYDDVVVSLNGEVAATYIQLRTFEQRLDIAQKNIELQTHSLKIAQALLNNQLGTQLDVDQASALRHQTQSSIAALRAGIIASKNALTLLLGKPPGSLDKLLLRQEQSIPDVNQVILVNIPARLIERRPDIRREAAKAAAQSAMIGIAQSELYPRLSLQGSFGLASSSASGVDVFDVLSTQTLMSKLGPTITWPILNYGRLKNNVRIQDAKFEQTLLVYQSSVLRALREVEDAMVAYQSAHQQILDLQQGVDASQHAVDLALLQYQNGLNDYTRVLSSQQLLLQQQDKLLVQQGDRSRQVVALYKALGGGWDTPQYQRTLPQPLREKMKQRTDWGDLLDESTPSNLHNQ